MTHFEEVQSSSSEPTEPRAVLRPLERGTVVQERVKCGRKNCKCATKGELHGPYAYHYARAFVNGTERLRKWYVPATDAPRLVASIKAARERRKQQCADLKHACAVLRALTSGETLTHERITELHRKLYGTGTSTEN